MLKNIFILVFFLMVLFGGYQLAKPNKTEEIPEKPLPTLQAEAKIILQPEDYTGVQLPVISLLIDFGKWGDKESESFVKGYVDVFEGGKQVKESHKQFLRLKGLVDRDRVLKTLLLSGEDWGRELLKNKLQQKILEASDLQLGGNRLSMLYLNGAYVGLCYSWRGELQPPAAVGYGSSKYFEKVLHFIKKFGITSTLHYSEVEALMDVDKFIDFFTTEIYFSPDSDNWKALKGYELFEALMSNRQFSTQFNKRFEILLGRYFEPSKMAAHIDELNKKLSPEIERHFKRVDEESGYHHWLKKIKALNDLCQNRPKKMKEEISMRIH